MTFNLSLFKSFDVSVGVLGHEIWSSAPCSAMASDGSGFGTDLHRSGSVLCCECLDLCWAVSGEGPAGPLD